MAATSERSRTEFMTDLHKLYPTCDSTTTTRLIDCPAVNGQKIDPNSLVSRPPTQTYEQFYCIPNTPDDITVESRRTDHERSYRKEDGDELFERLSRQAAEVAAAARFISKVNVVLLDSPSIASRTLRRPRLGSLNNVRDSIQNSSLHLSKPRSASMQAHSSTKRGRVAIPPPLELQKARHGAQEVQSPLPTRTSSKGAPSFDIARPLGSARSLPCSISSPGREIEPKSPLSILTPESANTFQFDFSIPSSLPSEPSLSRSGSGATTESQSPPTPSDSLSEEQIRQDIEAFVLEQGAYLRSSQRRTRRPPILGVEEEKLAAEHPLPQLPEESNKPKEMPAEVYTAVEPVVPLDEVDASPSTLRRKKSIFGWLQKKSEIEVDDLIDLYLTDEQREEEVKTIKRKPSRSRLTAFRHRVASTEPMPAKDI